MGVPWLSGAWGRAGVLGPLPPRCPAPMAPPPALAAPCRPLWLLGRGPAAKKNRAPRQRLGAARTSSALHKVLSHCAQSAFAHNLFVLYDKKQNKTKPPPPSSPAPLSWARLRYALVP